MSSTAACTGVGVPNYSCAATPQATADLYVANSSANWWGYPSGQSDFTYATLGSGLQRAQGRQSTDPTGATNITTMLIYQSSGVCDTTVETSGCYVPPECGNPGDGYTVQVRAATADGAIAGVGTCYDQCEVQAANTMGPGIDKNPDGTFAWLLWVKNTGATCGGTAATPAPPEPEPINPTGQENCVTTAAGTESCAGPYGENCGYLNDKFVCLGKTDPDECWINDDGSRWCGDSAPTPPVPDNGTRGVKATPQDTVAQEGPGGTTNTYNYYNSTTVTNSSSQSDTGNNPNRSDSTDPATTPTPVVDQGGDGDGLGGDTPYDPAVPELDEVAGFGDITQGFLDGVEGAPIVAAWTGIGSSIPAGSCPTANITVFGAAYSFTDTMCDIWDNTVSPLLSVVFLFVWPFLGLRIVMSA